MPGEAIGIVGKSGCGKSTVALAIMQYMGNNGDIVGGDIKFNGRDMTTMSDDELRRLRGSKISMVYQEPMASLNPSMLIGEQLAEVLVYHEGASLSQSKASAAEMLEAVRLPEPDQNHDIVSASDIWRTTTTRCHRDGTVIKTGIAVVG